MFVVLFFFYSEKQIFLLSAFRHCIFVWSFGRCSGRFFFPSFFFFFKQRMDSNSLVNEVEWSFSQFAESQSSQGCSIFLRKHKHFFVSISFEGLARLHVCLTCPICRKLLDDSVVAVQPCGHLYCSRCINTVIEKGFEESDCFEAYRFFLLQTRGIRKSRKRARKQTFSCPVCCGPAHKCFLKAVRIVSSCCQSIVSNAPELLQCILSLDLVKVWRSILMKNNTLRVAHSERTATAVRSGDSVGSVMDWPCSVTKGDEEANAFFLSTGKNIDPASILQPFKRCDSSFSCSASADSLGDRGSFVVLGSSLTSAPSGTEASTLRNPSQERSLQESMGRSREETSLNSSFVIFESADEVLSTFNPSTAGIIETSSGCEVITNLPEGEQESGVKHLSAGGAEKLESLTSSDAMLISATAFNPSLHTICKEVRFSILSSDKPQANSCHIVTPEVSPPPVYCSVDRESISACSPGVETNDSKPHSLMFGSSPSNSPPPALRTLLYDDSP